VSVPHNAMFVLNTNNLHIPISLLLSCPLSYFTDTKQVQVLLIAVTTFIIFSNILMFFIFSLTSSDDLPYWHN